MSQWEQFKQEANQWKETLDTKTTDAEIEAHTEMLNRAIAAYASRGGISPDPNSDPNYNRARDEQQWFSNVLKEYGDLNSRVSQQVNQITGDSDLKSRLRQIGQLQQDIAKLEQDLKAAQADADTAKARQGQIEKPNAETSHQQGFSGRLGFTRPLHPISIPILFVFGILFLFLTTFILRDLFATPQGNAWDVPAQNEGGVFALFQDSRFQSVIGGLVLVGSVAGILAHQGQFGKKLK